MGRLHHWVPRGWSAGLHLGGLQPLGHGSTPCTSTKQTNTKWSSGRAFTPGLAGSSPVVCSTPYWWNVYTSVLETDAERIGGSSPS